MMQLCLQCEPLRSPLPLRERVRVRVRRHWGHQGFSMIELILVMVVTGIIASVTALIFRPTLDSWSLDSSRLTETDSLSYAMNRIMDEIASIQSNTGVLTATASRLRFIGGTGATVDYQLTGSNLMRNSDILARDVQSMTVTYSNVTNAAIGTPAVSPSTTDIWKINVELVGLRDGETVRLQSAMHPRNFPRS